MRAGQINFRGQTVGGSLQVGDIASRTPELRWWVTCTRCGTVGQVRHSKLVTGAAVCPNSACGRTVETSASLGRVIQVARPTSSRDSADFNEFMRPYRAEAAAAAKREQERAAQQAAQKAKREAEDKIIDEAFKREYREYANHVLCEWGYETVGTSLEQWKSLPVHARQEIMEKIRREKQK